jgi:hypothetical protein
MKRRAQLVCEHLENISRQALEEHQEIIRKYVRGRQGVYSLYRRGKLYYVGLASNLRSRLKHHLRDRHGQSWDRFSVYLTIGDRHLREMEALLLRIWKPSGNKHKGKFAKSDDLRRRFRRDMRQKWRQQEGEMFGETTRHASRHVEQEKDGRTPILARYISRPLVLRVKFKGRWLKARVRRDGRVRFNGKLYTSPSVAAAKACERRSCNGWGFWKYQRAPGDWVKLDALRR